MMIFVDGDLFYCAAHCMQVATRNQSWFGALFCR